MTRPDGSCTLQVLRSGPVNVSLAAGVLLSAVVGMWVSQSETFTGCQYYYAVGASASVTLVLTSFAIVRNAWARWLFVVVWVLAAILVQDTLFSDPHPDEMSSWGYFVIYGAMLAVTPLSLLVAGATMGDTHRG